MKATRIPTVLLALAALTIAASGAAQAPAPAQKPITPPTVTVDGKTIPIPEPTVPQMMTLEGEFVRVA
mgnify:CR=1 FL=1